MIFLYFFIWRIFDFLISYFAPKFIPYLGFFPYQEIIKKSHLPQFIASFANFDGVHYIKIAQFGYQQYEQAFFPLYSLIIRYVNPIFGKNYLLTGLVISNIFFLLGLIVLKKYLTLTNWTIIFLLTFPTSFFFGALYTEGLFFFLVISSLYLLKKEKYLLVSILAILASLTRLMGIFLIIPFFFQLFKNRNKKYIFFLLSPFIGIIFYSLYLYKTTSDPLFFFNSQPVFGANRSTNLILLPQVYYRYLKILLTSRFDFQYIISLFELSVFNIIFICLISDFLKLIKNKINLERLGLNLFSFVNLILPTLTGTFSSIPRYALLSISFFIYLAEIKNKWIKISIIIIFSIFHILALAFFVRGYFIS